MPSNVINSVKDVAADRTAWYRYSYSIYDNVLLKTMSAAIISIVLFASISFTYGNKAADDTKKESVGQGKSVNLFYCVFLPIIFKINEQWP